MTASTKLQPVNELSKFRGFSNLLWKENKKWWRTRQWWINALLWVGMLGGLVFLMAFILPTIAAAVDDPSVSAAGGPQGFGLEMGKNVFFELGTMALAIGAVVLSFDMIIQEKQIGLTEWLLAKPVERRSYILAKVVSAGIAILILLIGLPSLTVYALLSVRSGMPVSPVHFFAGVGIMTTHTLFYLCLTLALGTFFNSRPPILGIAFASIMGGSMISGLIRPLTYVTPWVLGKLANLVNSGQTVPSTIVLAPVAASLVWCVVFLSVAIRKFSKTEF